MRIREIEYKDNKALEEIIKQSLEEVGLDIPGTAYFDPQLGKLAALYKEKPGTNYWVAVTNKDEVVGGVGIGQFAGDTNVGELQKLYLAPEARGKGLSKLLMKVALDFAKAHYVYCYLETSKKLQAASYLYRQFDFQELNEPLEGSVHGTMDRWYLKKL